MTTPEQADQLATDALTRWHDNPALFGEDVFGLGFWSKQREILSSVSTNEYTAVRSGNKCGKSTVACVLAWWWVFTRPRALVILTAPSYTQVEEVLWVEITRLHADIAKFPLGGKLSKVPEGGWHAKGKSGPRRIIGLSTDKPERAAGFSGPNTLVIIDEASGFDPKLYDSLRGNMAGGAKMLALSNPTQPAGWYYDAFHSAGSPWNKIHMSSRECAEAWPVELGAENGGGLATLKHCDTLLKEYGAGDARYQVRVGGDFPSESSDTMIPRRVVDAAIARYASTTPSGPLQIGVDVARYGDDRSSIVANRGNWLSRPTRLQGHDTVEVAKAVLRVVAEHRKTPNEKVSVRIDTSNMGGGVKDILKHGVSGVRRDENLELVEMMAANSSPSPQHSRLRDHVWEKFRSWLDESGALPNDRELATDIATPRREFDDKARIKVESKKAIRKRIGRSTDDGDAAGLAVYPASSSSALNKLILSDSFRPSPNRM